MSQSDALRSKVKRGKGKRKSSERRSFMKAFMKIGENLKRFFGKVASFFKSLFLVTPVVERVKETARLINPGVTIDQLIDLVDQMLIRGVFKVGDVCATSS